MRFTRAAVIGIVFGAATTLALANDTLTMDGLTYGSSTYTATIDGSQNVYAGPFNASLDGGGTFQVFCADIADETVFNTATPVVLQNTATLGSNYQYAAQLLNAFEPSAGSNLLDNAGLQVAIWETLFPSHTYTDFWQPGVVAQANVYLSQNVSGFSDVATYYNYGGANQSMIGAATPEPAPIAAVGLGLLGLIRRRRAKVS
jgi:hypothetical protein